LPFKVPFVDPKEHYRRLKPEIDGAITDCFAKGDLVMRQQLRDFEANLASFVGTKYAIGLNSGYHALHFSLLAANVGPGDEVITVGHTFVACVSAIIHCGATPVLVEVAEDYNMIPEEFEAAITPKTKAVMPVHLNGRVCNMDRIMEIANRHNIAVVEDAAQALGAKHGGTRAGAFGATGCFSFYPFKVLGGFGDGGAITTNDPDIALAVGRLRFNGEDRETGETTSPAPPHCLATAKPLAWAWISSSCAGIWSKTSAVPRGCVERALGLEPTNLLQARIPRTTSPCTSVRR